MRSSSLIACTLAVSAFAATDCNTLEEAKVAYNYNQGGEDWGLLEDVSGTVPIIAFPDCNGSKQSPIDLKKTSIA